MKCPFCIKICKKCKKILIANEMNFHKNKSGKYGFSSICKICKNKYAKEYRDNNKECYNNWYKDNKEKRSKQMSQYYKNNKEKRKEYGEQYYKNNKEEIKEHNKQWKKDNPEKVFNSHNKRRLKEEQGRGITKDQWIEMMEFFEWRCAYSGEYLGGNSNNRSIDHIVPLSNGGLNEIWNCVPMLKSYNSSKNTKNMLEWYMKQDFYSEERLNKIYEWQQYAFNKWGNK